MNELQENVAVADLETELDMIDFQEATHNRYNVSDIADYTITL